MTKYILHGGNSKDINPENDGFFREMTFGSVGKTYVLLNYFSREDAEVENLAEQDKQRFLQNSENREIEFEIAHPDRLTEQLQRAFVMYMRGGKTHMLTSKMKKTNNVESLFRNKVIAGSSAGVYFLSKYYWGNDTAKIGEGMGILNIKAFCHYSPQDTETVEKLLKYKESLPLFTLPNYKWTVWYK